MSALRIRSLLRTCKPLQSSVRMSSDHHEFGPTPERMRKHKSSLNDIPVPEGSWQEDYDKRNKKLNIKLAVVAAALGASILFASQSKAFYMHRIGDMTKIEINP